MSFKIIRSTAAQEQYDKWKVLGHSVRREDAFKKASGTDRYCDDIQLPHMLYGKILHSPYAHAKINSIDTSKAEALPGVAVVLTYKDLIDWGMMAPAIEEEPEEGQPLLPGAPAYILFNRVFYVGDLVAAVAAEDIAIAEKALDLIEVDYEELPFYLTAEEAMEPGATLLHSEFRADNLHSAQKFDPEIFGDEAAIEAGFAESDVILETEYREPAIKHMFLEHQTAVAKWEGEELQFWLSCQGTGSARNSLASLFKMPENKVHLYGLHAGGGFGGKGYNRSSATCALLAKKAAPRPVKMRTNAREQFVIGHKLEFGPSTWKFKIGANNDGTLKALQVSVMKGQGAYNRFQIRHGLSNVAFNYRCPVKEDIEYGVWTNALTAGALRAYGSQCAAFALDGAMNELSEKLGMDHADFIIKNGGVAGDYVSDTGHLCAGGSFPDLVEKLMEEFDWKNKWKGWGNPTAVNGSKRRGVGIAIANHCTGEFSSARDSGFVHLNFDGSAEVVNNIPDVGNGGDTSGCQVVAELLAIPIEKVTKVPAMPTGQAGSRIGYNASRGLPIVNTAIWNAAQEVRQILLTNAAYLLGVTPEEVDLKDQTAYVKADPTKSIAYPSLVSALGMIVGTGYGLVTDGPYAAKDPATGRYVIERGLFAACIEVEVDIDTGEVTILNSTVGAQAGNVVNPDIMRGQLIGGTVHGASQQLGEGYIYDDGTGTPLNTAIYNYQTLSSMDVSEDQYNGFMDSDPADAPLVPFNAKGAAEGIYAAAWPAICSAIYNAIGVRIREFPFQPERILSALGKSTFPKTKSVA